MVAVKEFRSWLLFHEIKALLDAQSREAVRLSGGQAPETGQMK